MRRAPTSTERLLWDLLRDRRLKGLKFRRQVPLGPYVADFLCLRHRLVIEADGPLHDVERDAVRDAWLMSQNFRVLRFSNDLVHRDRASVFAAILEAIATPSPSPLAGEGGPEGLG